MKKLLNTIDQRLEVSILGNDYVLEGNSYIIVPTHVADYWRNNLHKFLIVEDIKETPKVNVESIVEEITKEVKKTAKK